MATFDVVGPIVVPTQKQKSGGKLISTGKSVLKAFWEESDCGDRPGCYVFAIRFPKGIVPYYAGRTFGSLSKECFQYHKTDRYNKVLGGVEKGTPVMFFLPLVAAKGPVNKTAIKSLEDTLITVGAERNSKMMNISKVKTIEVIVRGVWGNIGAGKPSRAAHDFRKTMGL